jgi:multiple sugar transport system substrate-binding protein
MKQYSILKISPILIVIILLVIIITPTILQPSLASASLLTNITTSISDPKHDSLILFPSNQSSSADKTNVTLKGTFVRIPDETGIWNWRLLLQPALEELNRRHPDMNIRFEYIDPGNEQRIFMLDRISNGESFDIISVDEAWFADFAERGLVRNLTAEFEEWGRMGDLYGATIDGVVYNDTIYSLWLWTDVRGMWYWKDMLQEAGVDPESLKTWDGYISAAVKLKDFFGDRINQGVHLVGAPHAPVHWYPYLWMLGGELLELRQGHPTKGLFWFPSYNSSAGVKAMEFLKQQVDAGIEPQKHHSWGAEFANRTFPVMIEASQMPGEFPKESWPTLEQQVGFIPMFPVPNQTISTSTLIGGWQLAIPSTSQHSELAWEMITLMASPEILGPFLQEYGYLPTQHVLGDGPSSLPLKQSVPYFEEMVSMIPYGKSRPNVAEYPDILQDINQAIQQVYNGTKQPEEALDEAAANSARALGW